MKRILLSLIILVAVAGVSLADRSVQAGDWPLSKDRIIYNETLGTANTVEGITLTEPSVSLNIQAIGGDIRYCVGGTTTEAYWTIGQDQSFWDHLPFPLDDNTVLYFWTTSTASPQVQILQNYR